MGKALGKIKITIGQYQSRLFLVTFSKRLCFKHFHGYLEYHNILYLLQLALGKSAQIIMHRYKLPNQSVTQLTTMSLAVVFLMI